MVDGSVITAFRVDLGAGNGVVPVEGGVRRNASRSGDGKVARVGEGNAGCWGKRVRVRMGDDCGESGERRGATNAGE